MVSGAARQSLTAAVAVALAVATPRAAFAQGGDVGLPLGTAAPAAVVQDLDGHAVDLASLVGGRPVMIEFWATWCPICAALMPRVEAAHQKFGDRVGFVEVAVGVNESRTSVRRHVEAHHYPFTFLFDATGAAVRAYRAPTTSYVVVVNAAGQVVYTGTGAEQDLDATITRALGG